MLQVPDVVALHGQTARIHVGDEREGVEVVDRRLHGVRRTVLSAARYATPVTSA